MKAKAFHRQILPITSSESFQGISGDSKSSLLRKTMKKELLGKFGDLRLIGREMLSMIGTSRTLPTKGNRCLKLLKTETVTVKFLGKVITL